MTKANLAFLLGLGLMLGTAMCQYKPHPKSGQMLCETGSKRCPSGYTCHTDGFCYLPGDLPSGNPSPDGSTEDVTTATGGGGGGGIAGSTAAVSSQPGTGGQKGGATAPGSSAPPVGGTLLSSSATGLVTGGNTLTTVSGGGTGGRSSTTMATGGTASGGAPSSLTTSTMSTGGAGGTTKASGSVSTGPVTCTTDLMTARVGDRFDWIQGTPQTCGVQGSISAYGDGTTCTSPSPITATACAAGATGCCLKGTTVVDATFSKWGCGLNIDLNATGGAAPTKTFYAGAAKGFKITLAGTVGGGQKVRIMYSSTMIDPSSGTAPFKEVDGPGTYSILFSDATCPAWATGGKCIPVTGNAAYAMKIQFSGVGSATEPVGPFDICITSLTPIY